MRANSILLSRHRPPPQSRPPVGHRTASLPRASPPTACRDGASGGRTITVESWCLSSSSAPIRDRPPPPPPPPPPPLVGRFQMLAAAQDTKRRAAPGEAPEDDKAGGGIAAGKRLQADWVLNIGEHARAIFCAKLSRALAPNQSDIVVVGESPPPPQRLPTRARRLRSSSHAALFALGREPAATRSRRGRTSSHARPSLVVSACAAVARRRRACACVSRRRGARADVRRERTCGITRGRRVDALLPQGPAGGVVCWFPHACPVGDGPVPAGS